MTCSDSAVYPHFNIYPVIDLQIENPSEIISNARHKRVEMGLAALYPNFDICESKYWIVVPVLSVS